MKPLQGSLSKPPDSRCPVIPAGKCEHSNLYSCPRCNQRTNIQRKQTLDTQMNQRIFKITIVIQKDL